MNEQHKILQAIRQTVAEHYYIKPETIELKTHKREVLIPRQLCMYLARKNTKLSYRAIGYEYGKKDHATVIHACNVIKNLRHTDKHFNYEYRMEVVLKLAAKLKELNGIITVQDVIDSVMAKFEMLSKVEKLEVIDALSEFIKHDKSHV